jgi:phosphocarrier protein HPr
MLEIDVEVVNRAGIHTRPAASIVKTAARYRSEVYLVRDGFAINAKSIIGVMTLAAEQGSVLTIRTDGEDEELASKAIITLFEEGFGEL